MNVRIPLVISALGCCALIGAAKTASLSSNSFADKAATAGKTEIELSQLALDRSQNDRVKQLAQTMITDHESAAKQLEALAAQDKIHLPTALPRHASAAVNSLRQKKGAALDRAYVEQMVRDHEKAVALFTRSAGQAGIDQNLRDFAQQTLPTLNQHLQHAQEVAAEVSPAHAKVHRHEQRQTSSASSSERGS